MHARSRCLQLVNHLPSQIARPSSHTYRKMSTMKALVMKGDKEASVVFDRPLPQMRPGYVLVSPPYAMSLGMLARPF